MQRPFAITILAIFNALGGLALLGFAALFGFGAVGAGMDPAEPGAAVFLGVFAVFAGAMGLFHIVTAVGLWTLKNYGRICQLILSAIGLLGIPIGTIISAVILYYLTRPGVQILFSGRAEYSLTPDERQLVARDANQAAALVIVLIVAVFGGIAMIGIVAAIAIPSLLRARISANEASAIARLRSVASAQVTWASSHDGAYATPACLANPVSCGEAAGGPTYLDRDPTVGEPLSGYRFGFTQRAAVAIEAPAPPPDPTMPNIEGLTPEQLARVVEDMQAKADAQGAARPSTTTPGGYVAWAVPATPGTTGIRSFCVDETGIVRHYGRDAAWADPEGDAARCPEGGEPLP